MTVRQLLKIIILGMAVWGLSLVWPEINEVLTPGVTLGLIAGLGTADLALILSQHSNHRPSPAPGRTRSLLSPNPGGPA